MTSDTKRMYRIGEFARLAGVTPRALHHYDRLGLLRPKRTGAGYRAYAGADLERLAQVVALKFIGIPLKTIARLTAGRPKDLAQALRAQRQILEEKKRLLDQAITAIGKAEATLDAGNNADATLFTRIIEVINMQNENADWSKKYQTLVDAKVERLKAMSPETVAQLKKEWGVLIEEVRQVLGTDPAGPQAQAFASRWLDLVGRMMGRSVDPSMLTSAAQYQAGSKWGPAEADRPVWDFMQKALSSRTR